MGDYGPANCQVCNRTFTKRSHNSLVCSDECREEKDRQRKLQAAALRPGPKPCPICGAPARVYNGRVYITCGVLSCILAWRKKQLAKRYKVNPEKVKEEPLMRSCLKCDREFKAPHKYIRICPDCKNNFRDHATGA